MQLSDISTRYLSLFVHHNSDVHPTLTVTLTEALHHVKLNWISNTVGHSNYRIYRCITTSTDACTPNTVLTTVNSPTVEYLDTDLSLDQHVSYRIVPLFNAIEGNSSDIIDHWTGPSVPVLLSIPDKDRYVNHITVRWSAPTVNPNRFYRLTWMPDNCRYDIQDPIETTNYTTPETLSPHINYTFSMIAIEARQGLETTAATVMAQTTAHPTPSFTGQTLSKECVLGMKGTVGIDASATYKNSTGSVSPDLCSSTPSVGATGFTCTVTHYTAGNFTATWQVNDDKGGIGTGTREIQTYIHSPFTMSVPVMPTFSLHRDAMVGRVNP